jgi:hypothetical protein
MKPTILKEDYDLTLPVQRPASQGEKFIYIDYLNNEPFYVGMGNWSRVRDPDRNSFHVKMLENGHRKDCWIRRAVARNLSVTDAYNLETTLILCYGRKDVGTGVLVNKNNGIGEDLRPLQTLIKELATLRSFLAPVLGTMVSIVGIILLVGINYNQFNTMKRPRNDQRKTLRSLRTLHLQLG